MKINRPKQHRIYRYVIDWLYPNVCPMCGELIEHDADFCEECGDRITPYEGHDTVKYADGFTAGCIYDDNIKHAILHFKETRAGNFDYAFAVRIMQALKRDMPDIDFDVLIPIPMSKSSRKKRGYNQSELIARELGYLINVPCADVLVKSRETQMQKRLDISSRLTNMQGAFGMNEKASGIKDKTVLVIDDVCTTGSTLAEAAKVLKENGAAKVYAAAFAKTPYSH